MENYLILAFPVREGMERIIFFEKGNGVNIK